MTVTLTLEERRELRRALRRCSDCGRRHPDLAEFRAGGAELCYPCAHRRVWASWPSPAPWEMAA
jgi:hypothetical protein